MTEVPSVWRGSSRLADCETRVSSREVAACQSAAVFIVEGPQIKCPDSGHTTVLNTRSELTQIAALLNGGAAAAESSCKGLLWGRLLFCVLCHVKLIIYIIPTCLSSCTIHFQNHTCAVERDCKHWAAACPGFMLMYIH